MARHQPKQRKEKKAMRLSSSTRHCNADESQYIRVCTSTKVRLQLICEEVDAMVGEGEWTKDSGNKTMQPQAVKGECDLASRNKNRTTADSTEITHPSQWFVGPSLQLAPGATTTLHDSREISRIHDTARVTGCVTLVLFGTLDTVSVLYVLCDNIACTSNTSWISTRGAML